MYELHMPLIMLAKMKMEQGEISKDEAKKEFQRAILNLKMSLEILKYEPDGSFEKNIYHGAKGSLDPLESFASSFWTEDKEFSTAQDKKLIIYTNHLIRIFLWNKTMP